MTFGTLPEASVLTPLDAAAKANPDDWPEFGLAGARVHLPHDANANTSLLLATEHFPLTVTGQVETLPKQSWHLYRQTSTNRTSAVEISDVRSFAYGQYDDGSVALWAMGQAGWYTIKPCRAYREIYSDMTDAIKTLYFVADAYREQRRSGKSKSAALLPEYTAQELFEKYATEVMKVPKAAPEAAAKIYKHRDFLLASMIAGKEGLDWSKNPVYQHLCQEFPKDLAQVKQRLNGPVKQAQQLQRPRGDSVDTASTTSSLKRKRGRPPKSRSIDVISIGSSFSSAPPSEVAETRKPKAAKGGRFEASTEPQRKVPPTRRSRHNAAFNASESALGRPEVTATPNIDDSDEEAHPRHAQKGKSALRPKPSKGSKGGKGKSLGIEDDDEDELAADPPSSPTNGKRKLDKPSDNRRRKRRHSRQEVDEGIDIPESPSASDSITSPEDTTAGAASELAVRAKHEPDPVQEDTWICALDGCTHKVYLASKVESQRLIREHYKLHAYDEDERVQLVKKLQAPSLPVSHLMDRVRMQAKFEKFPGSNVAGTRFPQPIVARY